MSKKFGILFVCTGNICRSPTAEGVFRQRVRAAGLEDRLLIDSAGIASGHIGQPPDSRSIRAAQARSIEISDLRARGVEKTDFETFDLMLAMDGGHHAALTRMKPAGSRADIRMFLGGARDVPDPYYGGSEDFALVLDLAEEGAEALLEEIRRKAQGS